MDILESNCPQLLPKETRAYSLSSPPELSPTLLKSDELCFPGVSADETCFPDLIEPCDDGYLRSYWKRLQDITNHILLWGTACALSPEFDDQKCEGWEDVPELLDYARQLGHQALVDLNKMAEDLQRLQSHSELFEDTEKARYFWEKSVKILKQTKKLVGCFRLLHQAQDELEALRTKHTGSVPKKETVASPDADINDDVKPWQSWCRMLPLQQNSLAARDFRESHKEMVLSTSQLLPTQGVLIVEHWRRKIEAMVLDISQQSSNPAMVIKQLPSHNSVVLSTRQIAQKNAVVKEPAPTAPCTEQTKKLFAFGKQSREAEMARLMANMEQDVTTRGDRRGMFMGTFKTPEEKDHSADQVDQQE